MAPHAALSLLTFLLLLTLAPRIARAHGFCSDPRQRGALNVNQYLISTINSRAPRDYFSHFPGGGGRDKTRAASGNYWTPYEPTNRGFRWRAGVCGDALDKPQDHVRGGKYYFEGTEVRRYREGQVIDMEADIVAHHNGYFEFRICDVSRCGGEISRRCFTDGHCRLLERAPVSECERGGHPHCGPIDPAHPGRWYLPCRWDEREFLAGGRNRLMRYRLPPGLTCRHCVIQWYWMTANHCNPPGYVAYFRSEQAPRWPKCPGQAGAVGGYNPRRPDCVGQGDQFPEEYWSCADVAIEPAAPPPPPPTPRSPPQPLLQGRAESHPPAAEPQRTRALAAGPPAQKIEKCSRAFYLCRLPSGRSRRCCDADNGRCQYIGRGYHACIPNVYKVRAPKVW